MKTPRMIFCLVLLHLSLAVQGSAQGNTASLTGIVTDSQGASLANAAVTVTNKATSTENRGHYRCFGLLQLRGPSRGRLHLAG